MPFCDQKVTIFRFRAGYLKEYFGNNVKTENTMLLLTNCEVHTEKYSDRRFEVRTERSEVRTKS